MPNRPSSTPFNARHFGALNREGQKYVPFTCTGRCLNGDKKSPLLYPRPAIRTLKVPPKDPLTRVPSAGPLRKFSVLDGNFTRKSKSPVPAPMPRHTHGNLKYNFDYHEPTDKGFPSKPRIAIVPPASCKKGRSNGHRVSAQ